MGKKKGKNKLSYTLESSMRSFSLKFYDEQIIRGFGSPDQIDRLNSIKDLPDYEVQLKELGDKCKDSFISHLKSVDSSKFFVIGIYHDKDYVTNDFFAPSIEKRHCHIIGWSVNDVPYKLRTIFNILGLSLLPGDSAIYDYIETVIHRCEMLNYLTHNTEQAIKDGKYQYDDSELFSNYSMGYINSIRDTVTNNDSYKLSHVDQKRYDQLFYNCGFSNSSFNELYFSLPPYVRQNRSFTSVLKESYDHGLKDSINDNNEIDRLCIYIQGDSNTSKSYSSYHAAKDLYKRVFVVDGGKTGMFDDYDVTTRCLILNDYYLPNILNICDNKKAKLYKRGSGTPYFLGDVVVITGNKPFSVWLSDCNIHDKNQEQAMSTRFFVCEMCKFGDSYQARLIQTPTSYRGDSNKKVEDFLTFVEKFNSYSSTYIPNKQEDLNLDLKIKLLGVSKLWNSQNIL